MKKIMIFKVLFFVLVFNSCKVTYVPVNMEPIERTIQVEGNKDNLYVKANNWLAETFVSSKDVIQFNDKESGTVTGKCILKQFQAYNSYTNTWQNNGALNAIIKIQVKDNASKIIIDADDFQEVQSSLNKDYRYTKEKAIGDINKLMDSYEEYLKKRDNTF